VLFKIKHLKQMIVFCENWSSKNKKIKDGTVYFQKQNGYIYFWFYYFFAFEINYGCIYRSVNTIVDLKTEHNR